MAELIELHTINGKDLDLLTVEEKDRILAVLGYYYSGEDYRRYELVDPAGSRSIAYGSDAQHKWAVVELWDNLMIMREALGLDKDKPFDNLEYAAHPDRVTTRQEGDG